MLPPRFVPLALAALLVFAPPARAQRDVFSSYSSLNLGTQTRTNAIEADQTNRVWVVTTNGVAALVGDRLAPGFPLNESDFLGGTDDVLDVAFGALSDGENFFLGFDERIEFGRILDDRSVSIKDALPVSEILRSMASDGQASLWVGTNLGLLEYALGGGQPTLESRVFRQDEPISPVAVATWVTGDAEPVVDPAVVFFSEETERLYLARSRDQTATRLANAALERVAALAFESDDPADSSDGNLWVAGSSQGGNRQLVVRYPAQELRGANPSAATPTSFRFDEGDRTGLVIRDMAVGPFTGTLWVGTDRGAYFQTPDAQGNLDPAGWTLESSIPQSEGVDAVLADPSGNIWFGTDRGVRAILVRLLTLSSSRYVGEDARAEVTLEDLPGFAGNGVSQEAAVVEVTVGSTTKTFTPTEEDDSGSFSFSFGFSLSSESDDVFEVISTTDGTPIEAVYTFTDANGNQQTLVATASWSNERDFDDDAWIGDLCFINTLRN